MKKKGQTLSSLPALAILLVVIALTLSIGSSIVDSMRQDYCSNGYNTSNNQCNAGSVLDYRYNSTQEGAVGLDEIASWQDTIGLVVAASVIIGLVLTAFQFGKTEY